MEYNSDLGSVLHMRDYSMIRIPFMEVRSPKQSCFTNLRHVQTIACVVGLIARCVPLTNIFAHLCACVPCKFQLQSPINRKPRFFLALFKFGVFQIVTMFKLKSDIFHSILGTFHGRDPNVAHGLCVSENDPPL